MKPEDSSGAAVPGVAETAASPTLPRAIATRANALYGASIFLSSFLLFLIQPIIAKRILPWFGGSAAVWTTCLLFFQSVLVAGYTYAHVINAHLGRRAQAILHNALLAVAAASLPIIPSERWRPEGSGEPIGAILILLTATVGLPYLLLSATSPLLQAWFTQDRPGRDPYRLFGLSNLASMLALVGYPFLIEPWFGNRLQALGWAGAFVAFALLCALVAWGGNPAPAAQQGVAERASPSPRASDYAVWLSFSAAGSWLLVAVTNHLCQNLASIPLLWLAPLALYLLSFILAFGQTGFDPTRLRWFAVLLALGAMADLLAASSYQSVLKLQVPVFLAGLFLVCLYLNGELQRSRPEPRHLTAFYITLSLGGAIGALLVAVGAPLLLKGYFELGLGLVFTAALVGAVNVPAGPFRRAVGLATVAVVSACVLSATRHFNAYVIDSRRNFYGVLRVLEFPRTDEGEPFRRLFHGIITHGEQILSAPGRFRPSTYYVETSGVGRALQAQQARSGSMRVGIVGLGAGTLAAYGRPGDWYRFYEIDPDVVKAAQTDFTYLSDSKATIEVAVGDARTSLEREDPQRFDLLVVDAFSGDSIPVHLLTLEALRTYLRHVNDGGIVAFHVTNRYLDLPPVIESLAEATGTQARLVDKKGGDGSSASKWVLVARESHTLDAPEIAQGAPVSIPPRPGLRPWTDDDSNLVQILK